MATLVNYTCKIFIKVALEKIYMLSYSLKLMYFCQILATSGPMCYVLKK